MPQFVFVGFSDCYAAKTEAEILDVLYPFGNASAMKTLVAVNQRSHREQTDNNRENDEEFSRRGPAI